METKETITHNDLIKEEFFSRELLEVISHRPHWIVRKGLILIGCILITVLIIASFVRYPEHIRTTLKIVSTSSKKQFYGEILLPQPQSVRIKKGQEVIITLGSSKKETQFVTGTVSFISPVIQDDQRCKVYVTLRTNQHPYQHNLICKAQIITGDQQLLEKLLGTAWHFSL